MNSKRLFTLVLLSCFCCFPSAGFPQSLEGSWTLRVSAAETARIDWQPLESLPFDTLKNPYRLYSSDRERKVRLLVMPASVSLGTGLVFGILAYSQTIGTPDNFFYSSEDIATFNFSLAFALSGGVAFGVTDFILNGQVRRLPFDARAGTLGSYLGPYFGMLVPGVLISAYARAFVIGATLAVLAPTLAAWNRYVRLADRVQFESDRWERRNRYRIAPSVGFRQMPIGGGLAPTAGFTVTF